MTLQLTHARPAASPRRRVLVNLCCNHDRSGLFAGRAEGCVIEGKGWSIELDGTARLTVDSAGLRLRLHRTWFPFTAEREWVGNWCWNSYLLKRPQAIRLLHTLRRNGWTCSGGTSRICDWWDTLPAPEVTP